MSITLTESAAERVKNHLLDDVGKSLRFGVRKTGCSGYAYIVELSSDVNLDDHIFTSRGIDVIVDDESLKLVNGTTIHFRKQELGETFVFENPNVSAECGCGESFTVE